MYVRVFANLHTFRGMFTSQDSKQPVDAREPWRAYMRNFGIRLFKPIAWAAFACPLTEKLWALDSAALYFRSAQNEYAMFPRDGPRFSYSEVALSGTMRLTSPLHGNTLGLPGGGFVTIRASWSPAHCVIRFENDGALRKISFRPWKGAPSYWNLGTYDAAAFSREHKLAWPCR